MNQGQFYTFVHLSDVLVNKCRIHDGNRRPKSAHNKCIETFFSDLVADTVLRVS